jgi:hypothetical protein
MFNWEWKNLEGKQAQGSAPFFFVPNWYDISISSLALVFILYTYVVEHYFFIYVPPPPNWHIPSFDYIFWSDTRLWRRLSLRSGNRQKSKGSRASIKSIKAKRQRRLLAVAAAIRSSQVDIANSPSNEFLIPFFAEMRERPGNQSKEAILLDFLRNNRTGRRTTKAATGRIRKSRSAHVILSDIRIRCVIGRSARQHLM